MKKCNKEIFYFQMQIFRLPVVLFSLRTKKNLTSKERENREKSLEVRKQLQDDIGWTFSMWKLFHSTIRRFWFKALSPVTKRRFFNHSIALRGDSWNLPMNEMVLPMWINLFYRWVYLSSFIVERWHHEWNEKNNSRKTNIDWQFLSFKLIGEKRKKIRIENVITRSQV